MGSPSARSEGTPNIRSAAGLNSTIRWASLMVMIASIAEPTMPRNRLIVSMASRDAGGGVDWVAI